MDQWTNDPMDQWTNVPMYQWTNGQMDQWTKCGGVNQWMTLVHANDGGWLRGGSDGVQGDVRARRHLQTHGRVRKVLKIK